MYETFGPVTMYVGSSALVLVGAALSWITLSTPEFGRQDGGEGRSEPGTTIAPPEPGIVP